MLLCICLTANATDCLIENPLVRDNSAWQGTIGNAPVTLQFEENADYGIVGSYYYRNNFKELILKQDDSLDGWNEYNDKNQLTGSIENYNCEGDLLTAEWKSADSKTILPLKATRIKEYQKNRLENIKFIATPKVFGQRQYQILSVSNVKSTSLRLIAKGEGIAKLNTAFQKNYIFTIDDELQTIRNGKMEGREYSAESSLSVLNWNNTFITIKYTGGGYSGGAHPYWGSSAHVYNVMTGDEEKVNLWLTKDYKNELHEISNDTPLGKKLSKQYVAQRLKNAKNKDDIAMAKDCLGDINFYSSGTWVSSNSFIFQTAASYAASACIDEVTLPYEAVKPFLSERGKFVMRASQK